jgi:hypothetical protein
LKIKYFAVGIKTWLIVERKSQEKAMVLKFIQNLLNCLFRTCYDYSDLVKPIKMVKHSRIHIIYSFIYWGPFDKVSCAPILWSAGKFKRFKRYW